MTEVVTTALEFSVFIISDAELEKNECEGKRLDKIRNIGGANVAIIGLSA